jgi:hypothetical protein
MRKKLLAFSLILASFGFIGSALETHAGTLANASKPQFRIQIGPQRNRNRRNRYRDQDRYNRGYGYSNNYSPRVVTETRIVNNGWQRYRETYQTRFLPNGTTQTTVVSRERIY